MATTVAHLLYDAAASFFRWEGGGGTTKVGPNPRKVFNMIHSKPLHHCQYGGEDEFYEAALERMVGLA